MFVLFLKDDYFNGFILRGRNMLRQEIINIRAAHKPEHWGKELLCGIEIEKLIPCGGEEFDKM